MDLYHARQHLWELSAKLSRAGERARKRWIGDRLGQLDNGRIERLARALRQPRPASEELAAGVAIEADYFERNAERMRYPAFRAPGLLAGSGVIEAGCMTVIGARLKRSGMFWSVRGASAIIALRCGRLSGRFEDYWKNRSSAASGPAFMSRTRVIHEPSAGPRDAVA